jgi:hypothetical protein
MLFVLLLAGGIRLGAEPTTVAYLLNGLGLIAVCLSLYWLFRNWLSAGTRALLVLLVGVHKLILQNQVTGLETNFWTGLIFVGVVVYERFRETRSNRWLAALVIASFLACMTRPESVLIVGLWWLGALRTDWRRGLLGGFILLLAGGLYLLGLALYFGSPLPNPFYVKAGYSEGGLIYVILFVVAYMIFPWFLYGLATIPRTMLLSVYVLLVFYVFTNPLIGDNFRFLNPATALSVFIAAYGLYRLVTRFQRAPLLRCAAGAAVGYLLLVQPAAALTLERLQTLSVNAPHSPLYQTAEALRDTGVPLRVAYGDAGMLPYIARNVTFLDVVGLNDSAIARQGQREGAGWVKDYIFQWQPNLIGLYIEKDGHIFNRAHGVIGTAYSDLYTDARFAAYDLAGLVDYGGVYAAWFLRRDTPGYETVSAAIRQVAAPVTLTLIR